MSRSRQVSEPLPNGQKIRDRAERRHGVVLDHACQYAHPKAAPVYSYLVRWQDGQVQALSEAAFGGRDGVEITE